MDPDRDIAPSGRPKAVRLDPATECSPDLARVLAYWERKRQGRFAPRRADIDPADIVEVLPRTMLADVLREPLDFRYRLSGTAIDRLHGMGLTGKRPLDLVPAAYGRLVHEQCCETVRQGEPLLHAIQLDPQRPSLSFMRLATPLSEDGNAVTMLMIVDARQRNTRALGAFFESVAKQG